MSRKYYQPPKWPTRFLRWYCKPELLEDLEGDLSEYFQRNLEKRSVFSAKVIYTLDAIKFLRPYIIRRPSLIKTLIHLIMIGSYIKTSGRNIYRNKFFSAINIVGLAISMSVGLLMISMLSDVRSYDKFHTDHNRIYRLISRYEHNGRQDNDYHATTSLRAAKLLKTSVSGIDEVTIMHRQFAEDIQYNEKTIPLSGLFADEQFFKVFTFDLLEGNPALALKEPFSVVLTESSAKKLFGPSAAMGKVVVIGERNFAVTGVMRDVPKFSHFTFDMLGSLSTREILQRDDEEEMKWDNMWSTFAYMRISNDADLTVMRATLDNISAREDKTLNATHIKLDIEPMDGIIAGPNRSNQLGPTIGSTVIYIFSALALIVLLSACFNYTNLSIARAFKRSREVGIRKTIGAQRSHVVTQFMVESIIISMMSLVIAFVLFLIIRPHFLQIEESIQSLLMLQLSAKLIGLFILFALVVGACAGFAPAIFFSKLNAIQILKNIGSHYAIKGLTVRKVLIVFQYTLSIIFITGTLIFYKQYKHFIAFDLGFATENILNIDLQGAKAEVVESLVRQLPEVQDVSQSSVIMSVGNYYGTVVKYAGAPQDSAWVYYNAINDKYIPLHEIRLLAGRNFNSKLSTASESEVIVNGDFLRRFNIAADNPAKAIGEMINVNGQDLEIIGVADDFVYSRANSKTQKEVILRYENSAKFLNVKIQSNDWLATRAKLERIWEGIDDVHPLNAKFYNEQIEESFQGLKASIKLGGFIAFLVIVISSIGLLGMVVYTTETRLREMCIRKVFGAGNGGILVQLGGHFVLLLLIAAMIALPVTYLFFSQLMLPSIANHAPLGIIEFTVGFVLIIAVALSMIASQTFKVARTSPAEILKIE